MGGEKATPAPPDPQVLLAEPFDDPQSGWEISTSADFEVGYLDGDYRILV